MCMIVKEKIYINTNELGNNVGDFCKEFTYKNPEYAEKKRQKFSVANTPQYLYHYKIENMMGNQMLVLPRGGLKRVIELYERMHLPINIIDRMVFHSTIDCTLVETTLDKNQHRIVDVLYKNDGGLIEASPGLGKSISILGLIDKIKQPVLILVHEHRLSNQWLGEIKKRLSGNYSLGEFNGETKKDGDIVLGIINTIYTMFQENPEYFNKFGMIVVDEVHHCSAPMFHLVINNIPAKYRIGVTGTIERRDGKHILIYDTLGEKLIDIGAKDAKNRITNFDFRIINTNIRFEIPTRMRWTGQKREQTLDITGCISKLTQDTDRNNIIVSEVSRVIENGRFPLVLSDRIDHNKNIYEHIVSLGYKAVLLIGSTRKKTNWEEIRQDTSIQCIVGNTKIASEALNLPRLSDIFLTCPSSNLPQIKQRLGRIRRVLEGKPLPMVHDVCDNLAYYVDEDGRPVYLLQMLAAKRIRFYKKLIREYDESGGLESVV